MSTRGRRLRPKGLRTVAAQRSGRVTRESTHAPLPHAPTLAHEEGAIAVMVRAEAAKREGIDPKGEARRYARKRARKDLGQDGAREVEAHARTALDVAPPVGGTPAELRPYIDRAALDSVKAMREIGASTVTGRTSIATGHTLRALGLAMLAKGARDLNADTLRAATQLIDAGRREVMWAHEVERRAVIERHEPSPLDLLLADVAPDPGSDPPTDEQREDEQPTDPTEGRA